MKLLSWNVAGRIGKQALQCSYLKSHDPDLVALQEVTKKTIPLWRANLKALGFEKIIDSVPMAGTGPRRYGQVLASKFNTKESENAIETPWKERVTQLNVFFETAEVTLVTTHIPPGSSNKWVKIEQFEALKEGLRRLRPKPFILCGDFNSPMHEFIDGRIAVFGTKIVDEKIIVRQSIRNGSGQRWVDGEMGIIGGMAEIQARDVFRELNGYKTDDASYVTKYRGKSFPKRFDHVFATNDLIARRCWYDHRPRVENISDHSVMLAEFEAGIGTA